MLSKLEKMMELLSDERRVVQIIRFIYRMWALGLLFVHAEVLLGSVYLATLFTMGLYAATISRRPPNLRRSEHVVRVLFKSLVELSTALIFTLECHLQDGLFLVLHYRVPNGWIALVLWLVLFIGVEIMLESSTPEGDGPRVAVYKRNLWGRREIPIAVDLPEGVVEAVVEVNSQGQGAISVAVYDLVENPLFNLTARYGHLLTTLTSPPRTFTVVLRKDDDMLKSTAVTLKVSYRKQEQGTTTSQPPTLAAA